LTASWTIDSVNAADIAERFIDKEKATNDMKVNQQQETWLKPTNLQTTAFLTSNTFHSPNTPFFLPPPTPPPTPSNPYHHIIYLDTYYPAS
jgi:hypothetical protein